MRAKGWEPRSLSGKFPTSLSTRQTAQMKRIIGPRSIPFLARLGDWTCWKFALCRWHRCDRYLAVITAGKRPLEIERFILRPYTRPRRIVLRGNAVLSASDLFPFQRENYLRTQKFQVGNFGLRWLNWLFSSATINSLWRRESLWRRVNWGLFSKLRSERYLTDFKRAFHVECEQIRTNDSESVKESKNPLTFVYWVQFVKLFHLRITFFVVDTSLLCSPLENILTEYAIFF